MDKEKTKSKVELYQFVRKFLQKVRLTFCWYPFLTSKHVALGYVCFIACISLQMSSKLDA